MTIDIVNIEIFMRKESRILNYDRRLFSKTIWLRYTLESVFKCRLVNKIKLQAKPGYVGALG